MTKLKTMLAVCVVASMSSGLGGCFDELDDSLSNLASIPGAAVRRELDEAATAAEANETTAMNDWIRQKEFDNGVFNTNWYDDLSGCLAAASSWGGDSGMAIAACNATFGS